MEEDISKIYFSTHFTQEDDVGAPPPTSISCVNDNYFFYKIPTHFKCDDKQMVNEIVLINRYSIFDGV